MSYIPSPYHFVLLALATWRVWKIIADDDISQRPVNWLLSRKLAGKWAAQLVDCVWCLGWWLSGISYAVWLSIIGEWPDAVSEGVGAFGIWLALAAAVGLIGSAWHAVSE